MKTIAILGANGRLSNMAAKAFHKAGYSVIAVTRTGKSRNLPADIENRAANAHEVQSLIQATRGADFIFNGLNPPYTRWSKEAMPLAKNVIAAARSHGAVHLFPGNVYNYGTEIGLNMTEQTSFSPSVRKGLIRIQTEEVFQRASEEEGVKTLILRAGDFYGGPIEGSWFDLALASKLKKKVFTYPGPMNLPHAWAYLPDLANAFVSLAGLSNDLGKFERFNFQGHTLTGNEMLAHVETALKSPIKQASIPWFIFKVGGLVNAMWREIAEMSYLWSTPHSLGTTNADKLAPILDCTSPQSAVANALAELDFNVDLPESQQ